MKNLQGYTTYSVDLTGNPNDNMGTFVFYGYSNGKYQVIYNRNIILSEGLWNASYTAKEELTADTVVSIKECAYRTYELAETVEINNPSNLIIVERPVWSSFTVEALDNGGTYLPIGATKVF